jgi:CxxC-x17-CxxC domain-containing protein
MGNFKRTGQSDRGAHSGPRGQGGYGRRGGSGGARGRGFADGGEDRPMYQVTCAECGNACSVPFRPNGNKPVYCRDCFSQINAGPDGRGDDRPSRRPVRHNYDRDTNSGVRSPSAEHIDQQFAQLNEKLDRILQRLTPSYMRTRSKTTAADSAVVDEGDAETTADGTDFDGIS